VAPSAIASATQLAQQRNLPARFLQRDLFHLEPEWMGYFDYVLEHTCFCAIAPDLRSAYVNVVASLLRPGGELVALFWTHSMAGGPPFGSTPQELRDRFSPQFHIRLFEKASNSVESRRGEEYLARFQVWP
jgi:SAM-dependent methyltransferase